MTSRILYRMQPLAVAEMQHTEPLWASQRLASSTMLANHGLVAASAISCAFSHHALLARCVERPGRAIHNLQGHDMKRLIQIFAGLAVLGWAGAASADGMNARRA